MTKKSRARIQQDLAAGVVKMTTKQKQASANATNDVEIWSEVDLLRQRANEAMTAPSYVLPLIRSEELLKECNKQGVLTEFVNAAKVLGKDCQEFRTKLNDLGARHAGKTGACADDELLEGLAIGEEYIAFIQSYNTVVLPTIQQITEIAERVGSTHVLSQADDVVAEQSAPVAEEQPVNEEVGK